MRGWMFRAALLLTLLSIPAWAQRGGGGHGGGFHGGGGGFHGGGFHGAAGFRGGAGYGYRGGFHGGYGWHGGGYGWHGGNWNGYGWHGNGWARRGYGWGWSRAWGWGRYPWWSGGVVWWGPGWGWDDDVDNSDWNDSANASNYAASNYAASNYTATNYSAPPQDPPAYVYVVPPNSVGRAPAPGNTQAQINRLNQEVAQLRQQQESERLNNENPPAKLVFKDGHTETVTNYAMAGKTLWVFNEDHAHKIPISELDVAATNRDNQDRGVDFTIPASR